MTSKRKARKTNPTIFVFCEGETEKKYVDMLRLHFRVPVQIIPKVLSTKISNKTIAKHLANSGHSDIDKVFLFYDGDRQDIVDRILSISGSEALLSYPCVEFWFLLHFTDYRRCITSEKMVKEFIKCFPTYKKGEIEEKLTDMLMGRWKEAAVRAKSLPASENPSTNVYLLLEYLEQTKKA